MFDWNLIAQQVAEKNTKKEFVNASYLNKDGLTYLRILPFTTADGETKLYRKFYHHWSDLEVENKDTKEIEIKKRVVPCEGHGCRFCAIHDTLKEANIKESFKYSYNTYYITLGALIEKSGTRDYNYVSKNADGSVKLVPITFESGKKQTRAFDDFFKPENLYNLAETQVALAGKDIGEIYEALLDPASGFILRVNTKKNAEGRWATEMGMIPTSKPLVGTNVDLDNEIYNNYTKEFTDACYATTVKLANKMLEAKGKDGLYTQETKETRNTSVSMETTDKATAGTKQKKQTLKEDAGAEEKILTEDEEQIKAIFGDF